MNEGVNTSMEGILNILDAEPVKNLFSPITKEIGALLGDCGSILRFYSHRNLEAIFTKWAESRRAPLGITDFENVMPLLPLAASVSDEELQSRWATLLESAVVAKKGFLPSFGRTLSELTPEEARYLDRLRQASSARFRFAPDGVDIIRKPFSYSELLKVFDHSIDTNPHPIEWDVPGEKISHKEWVNAAKKQQADLVIQDFQRLGIISHSLHETTIPRSGGRQAPVVRGQRSKSRTLFSLTEYGLHFIIAVTPVSTWKAWASEVHPPTSGRVS
jgi:hypothetical protein